MSDVFISYSKSDFELAKSIAMFLIKKGLTVWFNVKLTSDHQFNKKNEIEIGRSTQTIVLWSQVSVKSVRVVQEARIAEKNDKLLSIKLDDCDLPEGFDDDSIRINRGSIELLDIYNNLDQLPRIKIKDELAAKSACENRLWSEIEGSNSIEDFQLYLEQFPEGMFVAQANKKLFSIEDNQKKQEIRDAEMKEKKSDNKKISEVEITNVILSHYEKKNTDDDMPDLSKFDESEGEAAHEKSVVIEPKEIVKTEEKTALDKSSETKVKQLKQKIITAKDVALTLNNELEKEIQEYRKGVEKDNETPKVILPEEAASFPEQDISENIDNAISDLINGSDEEDTLPEIDQDVQVARLQTVIEEEIQNFEEGALEDELDASVTEVSVKRDEITALAEQTTLMLADRKYQPLADEEKSKSENNTSQTENKSETDERRKVATSELDAKIEAETQENVATVVAKKLSDKSTSKVKSKVKDDIPDFLKAPNEEEEKPSPIKKTALRKETSRKEAEKTAPFINPSVKEVKGFVLKTAIKRVKKAGSFAQYTTRGHNEQINSSKFPWLTVCALIISVCVSLTFIAYGDLLSAAKWLAKRAENYKVIVHLKVPKEFVPPKPFKDCEICPSMVKVSAGVFEMGAPKDQGGSEAKPRHSVRITKDFAVGRFEVSFSEWDRCVADKGCRYRPQDSKWGRGDRPVINVSWNDVQAYIKWLNAKTKRNYRLLTESEWEYAARARSITPYSFGNYISYRRANFDRHESRTMPVQSYWANRFGLYQMHGNVAEFVQDCWHATYRNHPKDGSAWLKQNGGDCSLKVIRGGSWKGRTAELKSSSRSYVDINSRSNEVGFRIARD